MEDQINGKKRKQKSRTESPSSSKSSKREKSHHRKDSGVKIHSRKRRKMSSSISKLSPLEQLPIELLEHIFSYVPAPAFPQSSLIVGQKLSHRPTLLKICKQLWSQPCPRRMNALDRTKGDYAIEKQAFMECQWFNLDFLMDLQNTLGHPCNAHANRSCHHRTRQGHDAFHQNTTRPKSCWRDVSLPARFLAGPWSKADLDTIKFYLTELHLYVDLLVSPDAPELALRGVNNAIATNNWFMLRYLLDIPGSNVPLDIFNTSDLPHDFINKLAYELHHRFAFNIGQNPSISGFHSSKCWNYPYIRSTQAILRSAVLDYGCHKGIVGLILAHSIYDPGSIDYLDPQLWTWAATNKNTWLQGILKVFSVFIHDFDYFSGPDGRVTWTLGRFWNNLKEIVPNAHKSDYWAVNQEIHSPTTPSFPPNSFKTSTFPSDDDDDSDYSEALNGSSTDEDGLDPLGAAQPVPSNEIDTDEEEDDDDDDYDDNELGEDVEVDTVETPYVENAIELKFQSQQTSDQEDFEPSADNIELVNLYIMLKVLEVRWHVNIYSCPGHFVRGDPNGKIGAGQERFPISLKRLPVGKSGSK